MNRHDLNNYCQLAFINGVNDAISVILLHKVFVVLMTGNIIYFITDIATQANFSDIVRLSLLLTFVISGILVHNFIIKKSIEFRIILTIIFVLIYLVSGSLAVMYHNLSDTQFGFLIVANIATFMSVIINNIFYRLHATKFNLVAYTMNLLNLSHMIAEKRYSDIKLLGITFISFIGGLSIASALVTHLYFYTILIILPILINLYRTNRTIAIGNITN